MTIESNRCFKLVCAIISKAIVFSSICLLLPQVLNAQVLNCDGTAGVVTLNMPQHYTSSQWKSLTPGQEPVTAVRVSGGVAGHTLSLTSGWTNENVFFSQALQGGTQTYNISPPVSGLIIGYLTHPVGSEGVTSQVTLCTGLNESDVEVTNDTPVNDNIGIETDVSDTNDLTIVTAQESGRVISTGFDVSRRHYWANHEGVRNSLSPACVRLHDSFWTVGPDNKVYATWHPPVAEHPNGETCYFGHEHGDDPRASPFYTQAQYQQLRDDGLIPVPFGYANEVYAAAQGSRHEDHFGHKIFRENFETAYGNSVSPVSVQGTGSVCTALLKLHQGTHSADALTNHLHEVIAHISCTALPGYEASRVHTTALVPIGRPGWFSNNCGPYPVPVQTSGTRGSKENNAFAGSVSGNQPVALAGTDQSGNGGSSIRNGNMLTQFDTNQRIDGERVIPGAGCVNTYQTADSPKVNNYKFGHAMNDTWVRPLMITNATGDEPRMWIKSYYSVFNPARVFYVEADNSVGSRATLDMCRTPPNNPLSPTTPSALCASVLANPTIDKYSVESPYNGTIRNLNFKSLQISNFSGDTDIWTDAFGREVNSRDPSSAIKQYVSLGYNGVAGSGADGTIARPDSLQVCRKFSGPYPQNLSRTDPCYWNGNDDLLFAKEWWRDYSDPASRIHSPN